MQLGRLTESNKLPTGCLLEMFEDAVKPWTVHRSAVMKIALPGSPAGAIQMGRGAGRAVAAQLDLLCRRTLCRLVWHGEGWNAGAGWKAVVLVQGVLNIFQQLSIHMHDAPAQPSTCLQALKTCDSEHSQCSWQLLLSR